MDQKDDDLYYKFLSQQDGFILVYYASEPSTLSFIENTLKTLRNLKYEAILGVVVCLEDD